MGAAPWKNARRVSAISRACFVFTDCAAMCAEVPVLMCSHSEPFKRRWKLTEHPKADNLTERAGAQSFR